MEEYEAVAMMIVHEETSHAARTAKIIAQATSLKAALAMHDKNASSSEEEAKKPGRGDTVD